MTACRYLASREQFTVRVQARVGHPGRRRVRHYRTSRYNVLLTWSTSRWAGRSGSRPDLARDDLVEIDFPILGHAGCPQSLKCRVAAWAAPPATAVTGGDVAALELTGGPLPRDAGSARLMDPTAARGAEVAIFGYPQYPELRPNGGWSKMRLSGGVGDGAIQLDAVAAGPSPPSRRGRGGRRGQPRSAGVRDAGIARRLGVEQSTGAAPSRPGRACRASWRKSRRRRRICRHPRSGMRPGRIRAWPGARGRGRSGRGKPAPGREQAPAGVRSGRPAPAVLAVARGAVRRAAGWWRRGMRARCCCMPSAAGPGAAQVLAAAAGGAGHPARGRRRCCRRSASASRLGAATTGAVQAPGRSRCRAAGRARRAAGPAHAAAQAGRDCRRHRPAGAAADVRLGDAGRRPGHLWCLLRR